MPVVVFEIGTYHYSIESTLAAYNILDSDE